MSDDPPREEGDHGDPTSPEPEPESEGVELETREADAPRGISGAVKIGIVFVLLAGVVAFLLVGSGAGDAFVYSRLVHEVADNPAEYAGREMRVEGDLRQGSILFREDPCEWRFVLEKDGREMPVRYSQCVVPDTFRDGFGISVTVQGQIAADGTFHATEVVPRCPSKYEMQQRMDEGEEMPHVDPATIRSQES